jgi:hypothetical protein
MKFTLPPQLNIKRSAACDFLLEIESNTIANGLQTLLRSDDGPMSTKFYTKSTLKELFRADLTGTFPPSTLPLTDLQYFPKRGE